MTQQLEQSVASAAAADEDSEEGLDEDEDEDGADEQEDQGSDVEEDDEESSSSGDIEEADEDEDTVAVDPSFRQRVAEALQVSGMVTNGDAEDDADDSDSASEEAWDDEQMLKVDEQLSAVFRQRAASNKRSDLKRAFFWSGLHGFLR